MINRLVEDKRTEKMTIREIKQSVCERQFDSLTYNNRRAHKDTLSRANVVMYLCDYNGEIDSLCKVNDCEKYTYA